MEEKRKHKRLDLNVSVQLERLDEKGSSSVKFLPVEVTDISRSGIGFKCNEALDIKTYYDTKIQIWTREIVNAVIQIVRKEELSDGYTKYGCVFIGMNDTDALKIDIYQIFNDLTKEAEQTKSE